MGNSVALSKRTCQRMNAENRETLSLGSALGHPLPMMAEAVGKAPAPSS
jgi:hypothetical protein